MTADQKLDRLLKAVEVVLETGEFHLWFCNQMYSDKVDAEFSELEEAYEDMTQDQIEEWSKHQVVVNDI